MTHNGAMPGLGCTRGLCSHSFRFTGQVLTITDVVNSTGTSAATGVTLTDTLPAGLTFLAATGPVGSSSTQSAGVVTTTLGDLAQGTSATVTILATPNTAGSFTNNVSATSTNATTQTANFSGTANAAPATAPSFTVTKTAPATTPTPGQAFNFTITVKNTSTANAAPNVTLTDNLPSGLTFLSATGPTGSTFTVSNGTVTGTLGSLAAGATDTVMLAATASTASAGTTLTNSATATSSAGNATPGTGTATATVTIGSAAASAASLTVTKTGPTSSIVVGQDITYTITVANTGATTATATTVTDNLPPNESFLFMSSNIATAVPGGSLTQSGNTLIFTLGDIAGGATDTFNFSVTPLTLGPVTNSATATTTAGVTSTTTTTGATTLTVARAASKTTLSVTPPNFPPSPIVLGGLLDFSAFVEPASVGAVIPTGTVTFMEGATTVATAALGSSGIAQFSTTSLSTIGMHTFTAVYSGDANFFSSTSEPETITVNKGLTLTIVTASPNPSTSGQNVTFTATVGAQPQSQGVPPPAVTPTGTVTFSEGNTTLATAALSNGKATFATSTLSVGTHIITVTYSGDSTFSDSSGNTTLTVNSTTPPTMACDTTAFVHQVYRDLLNREADPGGLANWVNVANTSGEMAVVTGIEGSLEFHMDEVQFLYQKFLRRAADATGLAGWTSFLNGGGTFQQLEAFILGSEEYFTRFGMSTNTGFVTQLYHDLLGRAPDPGGLAAWTNAIANFTNNNSNNEDNNLDFGARGDVAFLILSSQEARMDQVESYYQQFLGRMADPGGLASWVGLLQNGKTNEFVVAGIVGSEEYCIRATAGLGSPVNPNFFTPANLATGAPGAPVPAGFMFP